MSKTSLIIAIVCGLITAVIVTLHLYSERTTELGRVWPPPAHSTAYHNVPPEALRQFMGLPR